MEIPWYGWGAALGVIAWGVMVIVGATGYSRSKGGGAKATAIMEKTIASNEAVLAKLDSIEARLGAVEKTLTDIP